MPSSSEDGAREQPIHLPAYEYAAVFEKTPDAYLVVDPSFTIMAVNDAYCETTMTSRDGIIGRHLFEAFPDDPDDSAADGVDNLRASLLKVLKSRLPDRMRLLKYSLRRPGGAYEPRYWSVINVPVMGGDGYVRWIIHSIEDVSHYVEEGEDTLAAPDASALRGIAQRLRDAEYQLDVEREESARLREMTARPSGP